MRVSEDDYISLMILTSAGYIGKESREMYIDGHFLNLKAVSCFDNSEIKKLKCAFNEAKKQANKDSAFGALIYVVDCISKEKFYQALCEKYELKRKEQTASDPAESE